MMRRGPLPGGGATPRGGICGVAPGREAIGLGRRTTGALTLGGGGGTAFEKPGGSAGACAPDNGRGTDIAGCVRVVGAEAPEASKRMGGAVSPLLLTMAVVWSRWSFHCTLLSTS